jgi:hypothetical protein
MDNNKEYIINIRVSKDTYNKLKDKAKENSESLSSLVRKTLDDSYEIFNDLKKDIFGDSNKNTNNIIHYQKVIVAKDVTCDRCQAPIAKGSQVYLGETKTGTKKYFCNNCCVNN